MNVHKMLLNVLTNVVSISLLTFNILRLQYLDIALLLFLDRALNRLFYFVFQTSNRQLNKID